jgi:putative SOS response-associated peptidase YedK
MEAFMCGRFTITLEAADLQQDLGVAEMPGDWQPRYNVAPTQPVAAVVDAATRRAEWLKWGLIPSWAKDPSIGSRLINARSETIAEKPSFRSAFSKRRCLILADGFYEWKRQPDQKGLSQPYYFHRTDRKPFAFAGLWEIWKPAEGDFIRSCTIITCAANEVVSSVHERMPVILSGEQMWKWLEPGSPETLMGFLQPYPAKGMSAYAISKAVNDANRESPDLVKGLDLAQ